MSYWNYRVVSRSYAADNGNDPETQHSIHEAYYDDGSTVPHSITREPVVIAADSAEGLKKVLEMMAAALERPVLRWEDF